MRTQSLSHGSHYVLGAQHANLDGINTHVGKKGINLFLYECSGDRHHTRHGLRVLSRQSGDDTGCKRSQRRHHLDVGQNTGAAGRVDACNRQDIFDVSCAHISLTNCI